MNFSNELKVALTILVALVAAFLGYRVMSDLPLFRQSTVVYSYFDRTDGLTPGNYVYVNGVKVGSIKRLELAKGDSVRVTMTFDLGVEIPKNSVAYLESSGLLDEKAIIVERGDSPEDIQYGDYLEGEYRGGMMETLKQEGEALSEDVSESFKQLNRLLAQLNTMLTDETKGQVDTVLNNIESTTNEVATVFRKKRSDLESSIEHAQKFLANVDTVSMRNKARVDSVLTGLDRSLTELEMLTRDLNQTNAELNRILTKINNGEGSLGKFVNDPSFYNNLDSLSVEMKMLIKNINEKPGEYLKHMRLIEVF